MRHEGTGFELERVRERLRRAPSSLPLIADNLGRLLSQATDRLHVASRALLAAIGSLSSPTPHAASLAEGPRATETPPEVAARTGAPGTPSVAGRRDGGHAGPLQDWREIARRTFVAIGIFSVFVNLLMLTMPIYLFQISDRVLTSRSADTLLMLSLLALGFIVVLSLLDTLRRQVLGRLATRMETILGGPVVASIIASAPASDGGNLQPLRNLHQVRGFMSSPTMVVLFDVPMAPLYFAAVFLIHPSLGFLTLLAGLVLFIIALFNQSSTSVPLGQANKHAGKAAAHADAMARNAQVINAMGMLDASISQWGREQAMALNRQLTALDSSFWIAGTSRFFRLVTQIVILGWGAHLALNGQLTGGMMIAASIIAGRALQPLEGMIEGWRSVMQTRAAYARVRTAVETLHKERPHLRLPKPKGRLTVDKLLYLPPGSKEPVLNGVSFELEPGETLAIVGPSGSGKSTLARILVGCLLPTAGKVRLDGTELRNWDRTQFGEYTGYLPQEVELFPGSIKENVCRMRSDLLDDQIYEAATLCGVHDMICQLPSGYETVLERNGAPLSGGQKQRIALARAFFGNPSLVMLDEPNSNLDAAGELALTETVQRAKKRRVTTIVITQRPALLNIVDKVLILRGGRAEAFGAPKDVLRRLMNAKTLPTPAPEPANAAPEASPAAEDAEPVKDANR